MALKNLKNTELTVFVNKLTILYINYFENILRTYEMQMGSNTIDVILVNPVDRQAVYQ